MSAGDVAPGLIVVLSGQSGDQRRTALGRRELIVTHGPGQFIGELAQLSARPSLVNAEARRADRGAGRPLASGCAT